MAECASHLLSQQSGEEINGHDDRPLELKQGKHGQTSAHQELSTNTLPAPDAANRQNQLVAQGVRKPDKILPQTLMEPTTVNFYLLVLGEPRIEVASINIGNEETMIPLFQVQGEKNMWYCSVTFNCEPIKHNLKYKYNLQVGGHDHNWRLGGKVKPHDVTEKDERSITNQVQFDVFHFPDGRHCEGETIPKGVEYYLEWFFQFVDNSTLSYILTFVHSFNTKVLTKQWATKLVDWIKKQVLHSATEDIQRLYLCMILSYIPNICAEPPFKLRPHMKDKKVGDGLLKSLKTCAQLNFLSEFDCRFLHEIAMILVENSSSPGWLTLAAYFYPYLLIGFITHVKYDKVTNNCEEYESLVAQLFSCIKVENKNDQADHQELLCLVLKSAPNLVVAMNLFGRYDMSKLFASEDEMAAFFAKHFEMAQSKTKKKKGSGPRLSELHQMPKKIVRKVPKLLQLTLLDYSKSDDDLKGKERDVFIKFILAMKDPDVKQLTEILINLSKSKSLSVQDLLLEILNNDNFKESWSKIAHEKKVDICESWVISRTSNIEDVSGLDTLTKVVTVYQCIDGLMRCSLNVSLQETLASDVHARVVNLYTKDAVSVFKAFVHIDKLLPTVQKCYISHVKQILTPELLKKSINFLKENLNSSSLRPELLKTILKIIDQPTVKKNGIFSEEDLKPILDWYDVWIILLEANEILESIEKYQDGKKNCQQLAEWILAGSISPKFTEELYKVKENVSLLCASVKSKEESKQSFQSHIAELMSVVENVPKKFQCLEFAINFGKKLSKEVYSAAKIKNIESILETINNLRTKWRTRKVDELRSDTFWGTLLPLLEPAETLQPLANSVSFEAVARECLELKKSDEGNDGRTMDFSSLMEIITSTAKQDFEAHWNSVSQYPGTTIVGEMKSMLGTIKDQNQLDNEFELLQKYFNKPFPTDVKSYVQNCLMYQSAYETTQHINGTLAIFKLTNLSEKEKSCLPKFPTTLEKFETLTLKKLNELMTEFNQKIQLFSGEGLECVFKELSCCRELISFMEETVDDDIRFLIDAVEEHFDQFVSESSVSDLIQVHSFLAPLIKKKSVEKLDLSGFLSILKKSRVRLEDIAGRIKQCSMNVNSLRGLYKSIANRGEMTKETIRNCLERGEYWVTQKEGKRETTVSYKSQENGEGKKYTLPELHDLRSRAHLLIATSHKNIINATSSDSNECSEDSTQCRVDIDFEKFINQVNLLTEIFTLLSTLRSSGHVKYRNFEKKFKSTDELTEQRDTLQKAKQEWENALKVARKKYYFLRYYRSDQICIIYGILTNGSKVKCDEVLSLINFVDRTITEQQLKLHQGQHSDSNNDPQSLLETVGEELKKMFRQSKSVVRPISDGCISLSEDANTMDTVTPGEIFVASLGPDSPLIANVILKLYENTSNAFPEPHQIVFCSSQTTWEEIHLLLERCFTQSEYFHHKGLFCITNVELLPNELQFRLVNALKEKQNCYQSGKNYFQLAMVCRGGNYNHIVEQFLAYTHRIAGMSDLDLEQRLKSRWPDVKIITSTLPGLGKTEQIKTEALEKSMNVATVLISGPFNPRKLIRRLKKLTINNYHCLHVDIGEVSDPFLLEIFLFQLIVTGMVSAGSQFYHLPTTHIYIEIANTLNNWLWESFVVLKCFTHINLESLNYENLLVSTEITSNIQVVCRYLDIFDRRCIESEEIRFSESTRFDSSLLERYQKLLAKYYSSNDNISFTTLHAFLGFLAAQLAKLSESAFFTPAAIESMIGEKTQGVRTNLFDALLKGSKEFASRATTICCPSESIGPSIKSAKKMVDRAERMIKWEDSNHLLVVFCRNSQAITAIYRDRSLVPSSVKNLFKSQGVRGNTELEDFSVFSQEQLQEKLEKIVCTEPVKTNNLFPNYALTPDNILKMILIILRIRANVPVIIMGETGCGKTSLVRYLANTCGVKFCTFNFHAGISEEDIVAFIQMKNDINEQTWIFLDEINTCDHLGLISDVICHHSLLGQPLSKNLFFLAACNPYKLRPEEHIKTAGLEGKNITDEYSKLVYRVHPLPEAMIDYVWDYGSLAPEDERSYIQRMVRDLPGQYEEMLVELLAASQKFVRDAERNHFCVSLRDVYRCIHLIEWFENMRKKRQNLKESEKECPSYLQQCKEMSQRYKENPMIKSIVLALAHCYLSRLPTAELRKDYRKCMMEVFSYHDAKMTVTGDWDNFAAIVRMEEEDYLDRMEIPHGTARNAALRENVFVMLVCILNRIPIFVVGKPGCSKSLSIQLIRSNLRRRDSQNDLFQKLPQLYFVSYQGSESSTSEGIIKVFEKARNYKSHNNDGNVLPVVLLDEVGLAENSKYNPLKVLHNLLEPGEGKFPDVAVVGISNWSLDAAKMNRAIHLSRPEPTKEDLFETGKSLTIDNNSQQLGEQELRCLAEAYFKYQTQQSHANFHGLRDYYFLIKNLTRGSNVNISLQRNFGGLSDGFSHIQKTFLEGLKKFMTLGDQEITPVTDLIEANIKDPHARHLMLIGNENSVIDILKQSLAKLEKEVITIFGSRLEEDLSEDYNYRILSRIILCMERNCILILRDLESIYGSLYDMLNQNYTVVGNKKNCRVALGAYSNPMCQVHEEFRCIVLIDQHNVDYSDPPFLNRFEKQLLRYSDVLTEEQKSVIKKLSDWVDGMSAVKSLEAHFNKTDMFIGFHEDTLQSLVLSHGQLIDSSADDLKKYKDDLMWVASPDGVLRTQKCRFLTKDSHEVQELRDEYFKKPLHKGLAVFMKYVMTNHQISSFFAGDEIGSKTVVMTFANIHTDILQCLGNGARCQVERLSAYKSEKQFTERITEFWNVPEKELLVLQCKSDLDRRHLLFARFIIEQTRNSYKQGSSGKFRYGHKHVCIIIHVMRVVNDDNVPWQFSFLCGWRQVFLDVLEAPPVPLNDNVGEGIQNFLRTSDWRIRKIAEDHLPWCLTCMKYTQVNLDVFPMAKNLFNSKDVSQAIETLILQTIDSNAHQRDQETHLKENWQVKVACDRQSLVNSSTLNCAMEQYVKRSIRNLLAKIVYFLEKENAWPPHLAGDSSEIQNLNVKELWCSCLVNNTIVEISDISEPRGNQSYILEGTKLDLSLPFSQVVARKVNSFREQFLDEYCSLMENEENFGKDGQLQMTVEQEQLKGFAVKISNMVSCYTSDCHYLYMEDILDVVTAEFREALPRSHRVSIAQIKFISGVRQSLPANDMAEFCTILHAFLWINRKKIIDLLKMVDCCRPFIELHDLTNLTDDHYRSSKKILLMKGGRSPNLQEEINNSNQDSRSLEDILVTAYCEKMFPSAETIHGDLEQWRRRATLFLSWASKVSQYPPEFHFLRLCVDFSRIIPNTKLSSLLYTLNDIGKSLSPRYLDHEESFKEITDKIIKPAEEEVSGDEEKYEALQKFSALSYGRCIDTNADACAARPIIEEVLSLKRPELVMMMSTVVLRLLLIEKMQSPRIFMDLITNPGAIENCPCLQNIDQIFKRCFLEGSIHHDSYPAVMICDLIQPLINYNPFENSDEKDNSTFNFINVNSPDCEVLMLARSCTKLISQNDEDERGLRVLSAVAFLRKFLTELAEFIARNPRAVNVKDSPHAILMTEINSLLRNSTTPLQLFLMKQLRKQFSFFDLQKLFKTSNVLPTITELWRDEKSQNKAVFTSVLKYPEYKEAEAAYWKFLSADDEQPMQEFLNKCKRSADYAFALFGILINMVYMKRAVRKLGEKEERFVKFVERDISSSSLSSKELLLSVMGRRHFNCEQLQLSPETSVEDVEIALLILHIAWMVPSVQSLQTPNVGTDHDERRSLFDYIPFSEKSFRVTCSCGLRLAFKANANTTKCPQCEKDLKNEARSGTCPGTQPNNLKSDLTPAWDICTKHMSPAAYRALRLIVYSSHYTRLAVETSSGKGLPNASQLMNLERISKTKAASYLETVKNDLSCLMKILSCTKTIAIKTMHLVVEATSDLIKDETLGENDFLWKERFNKRTEEVFLKSRKMPNEIKEMVKLKQMEDSEGLVTLESRILELDEYPEDAEEQNKQLKRLFRITKQLSFEDFHSAFLHSPEEVKTKHSFLTLFFAKFQQLPIIGHLYHLLKWSRLVSSALNHRISRKDAQSKSIDDFITDYFPESKRTAEKIDGLNLLFNKFKEAWNKMRKLVNKELGDKKPNEMPYLQENVCVAYCLMESDNGIFLRTAVEILVSYQNSILDEILSISSHQHPALHALEKHNCSGVECVTIQIVKEKEIIRFQWSDDLLKFAQNNPEYGRGQEITYDFERMEMELAAKIGLGKCYLTGTLDKFIFAKELYHTCGPLLTEIRSRVTQSNELPEDVRRGLNSMKELGMKQAQDLLQHIEVVMYLLFQHKLKDFEDEMTLVELAGQCSTMLPSPFPVDLLPKPRSSIKLRHVCALYEALEDMLADGAIEGIAEIFRKKFSNYMKDIIEAMLSKNVNQLKPPNFLKTLRRFVFRYLSSGTERYWPKESTPLRSSLEEPSLWSPLEPPNLDEIPREITLQYTHSTLKYLEEQLNKVQSGKKNTNRKKGNVRITATSLQLHNFSST